MHKCFTHILFNKIKIELTEIKLVTFTFGSHVLTRLESISGDELGTPGLGVQHSNYWEN